MKKARYRPNPDVLLWLGVLPLALALIAYQTTSEHVRSVEHTLSTDDLIQRLDELLSTVQDAETGQRGYLLTGEEQYRAPFDQAKATLDEELAGVDRAAAENGVPHEQIAELHRLTGLKMAELEKTIALRNGPGLSAALQVMETNRGFEYMREIRSLVGKLKKREDDAFRQQLALQRRRQLQLDAVLGLGVILGFLLVYVAYRGGASYVRERDRVEAEIRGLNQTLEARVQERTAELEARTRELELSSLDLQRSYDDLSQFAYVASHDLQEPLRTIASYMGLLKRRYERQLDEAGKKYIGYAIEGATRMQTLIYDLLSYSRAGTQAAEKKTIPFDRVLQNALENLKAAIEESSAVVHHDGLPVIEGDETTLTQVMQNLIANSIKFRKPNIRPEIFVSARRDSEEWIFEVADNGIGFDQQYNDRIFQVFQRLHGIGDYPGNGIGLAICRRLIQHHGGRLWAESEPGVGSKFFFSLPLA